MVCPYTAALNSHTTLQLSPYLAKSALPRSGFVQRPKVAVEASGQFASKRPVRTAGLTCAPTISVEGKSTCGTTNRDCPLQICRKDVSRRPIWQSQ